MFMLKFANGNVIDLETYFRGRYYSFIDIYKHDIDILNDYFNGDFEMIEDTTYEECVDIINSYIENWINDDDLIPIFSNGVELSERDFEFTDYMNIYENMFDTYKNACRLHFNIYS